MKKKSVSAPKCGIICYLPPDSYPGFQAFKANLEEFKPANDIIWYSERPDNPMSYGDYRQIPNPGFLNDPDKVAHFVFLYGLRFSKWANWDYLMVLESDCRVNRESWDDVMLSEFFDNGKNKICGGTITVQNWDGNSVTASDTKAVMTGSKQDFQIINPIPGGVTAVYPNCALSIFCVESLMSMWKPDATFVDAATNLPPWNVHVGRQIALKYGDDAVKRVLALQTVCSHKDGSKNESDRHRWLSEKKCVAVHPVETYWSNAPIIDSTVPLRSEKRTLDFVTLWGMCWSHDANMLDRTVRVLNYCGSLIDFKRVVLFSRYWPKRKLNGDCMQIPSLDWDGFNIFVNRVVPMMITTDYAMSVHEDGFILNPSMWMDDFLQYDYIGAPWPDCTPFKDAPVGNGGFSIESRQMMDAKLKLPFDDNAVVTASDMFVCNTHRKALESQGIRFAPKELAAKFSTELTDRDKASFGFHGRKEGDALVKYNEGWRRIAASGF